MAYQLEGRLLEVCDCNVLCPCWIGENPDNGTCQGTVAWHIDQSSIEGVDVSGRSLVATGHIPGNVLDEGSWKVVVYIDEGATDAQQAALLKVWTGQLGGPVADLAKLIGEVVAVERVPITFTVMKGKGMLRIGAGAEPALIAELAPYEGATGKPTTLVDTVFSTIPGSPAYVGKASTYRRRSSQHGLADVDLHGHNAVQGNFSFVA